MSKSLELNDSNERSLSSQREETIEKQLANIDEDIINIIEGHKKTKEKLSLESDIQKIENEKIRRRILFVSHLIIGIALILLGISATLLCTFKVTDIVSISIEESVILIGIGFALLSGKSLLDSLSKLISNRQKVEE